MLSTITIKLWTNNESTVVMYIQYTKQPARINNKIGPDTESGKISKIIMQLAHSRTGKEK